MLELESKVTETIKHTNKCMIVVEKKKGAERIFQEIMHGRRAGCSP